MTQQPKRRPGDRNPEPDPKHMEPWTDYGGRQLGRGDYGFSRAISAVLDWRKRRKAMKNR